MFRHSFRSYKVHVWVYFQLPRSINDLENIDFQSKFDSLLTSETVVFGHFGARKSRILDFFEVVLELFRKCLGIVFDLKRPTFGCIFSSKGR